MAKVIIGVDPHKLSATIEIVDSHEKLLGCGRFSTDQAGYTAIRAHAKTQPERIWAIEGSNGAGRPLAQCLLGAGEHAVDVPAKLAARGPALRSCSGSSTALRDPARSPSCCTRSDCPTGASTSRRGRAPQHGRGPAPGLAERLGAVGVRSA